jgi:hypothetical protein
VSYGESLSKVKEITKLEHTDSTIYVELTRPKVGLIYMIRWKWDSMSSSG